MNRSINFFGLGAQKSGTTTLHDILKQHPDVALPKFKETHYFSTDKTYKKGINHYFSYYFPKIAEGKIIGEIDPDYLVCERCPERIRDNFGTDLKFVIILRNPIDRAYSSYLMAKSRDYEKLSFVEALEKESERSNTAFEKLHFSYLRRSLYSSQIQSYFDLFPKANFHIIKFEDFTQNIEKSIAEIISFLNLEAFSFEYKKASNIATEPKSKWLRNFIYKPLWLKKAGHVLIPSRAIRGKIMHNLNQANLKPLSEKESLSNELRKELYTKYFKDDIDKLENLINKDLSNWKC